MVYNQNVLESKKEGLCYMVEKKSFAEKILQFNDNLLHEIPDLPTGFKVINPYNGDQKEKVKKITTAFYQKYYNDSCPRCLTLGSSSARRGTAVTGVPFEDANHLQSDNWQYLFLVAKCIQCSTKKYGLEN